MVKVRTNRGRLPGTKMTARFNCSEYPSSPSRPEIARRRESSGYQASGITCTVMEMFRYSLRASE